MKPKPLFFYYVLQSQPSFRFVLFFLGVAYTQLFFEFLKLHFEPFEYGYAVNAQPEFSLLLRVPLHGCRRGLRPELLLVFLRIEPSLELHGLQADNPPCQFLGEPHFPALFGYGQQFLHDREIGVYLFQSVVVFPDFLLVAPVYLVYLAVVAVLHFCLFPLFDLYLSLQIGYVLLQALILRFQPLDLAAAQKRTHPVRYGCGCVHRRTLHLLHVDFPLDLFQLLLCFLFQPQQVFYVLLQAVLPFHQFLVILRGRYMFCQRAVHASLQAVLVHDLGIGVLIVFQLVPCHDVISAQPHILRVLLSVLLLPVLFVLSGFPALPGHYRYDSGVYVRRLLVHVQDCRHEVPLAVCFPEPLQVVVAPAVKSPVLFHTLHVLVASGEQHPDCPYLVGTYLAFDACRLYPVRYRLRTVPYHFGELHQFPVQVRSRSVRILRVYGALYVCGHCAVRTLCLFQMQNCISHNCNTFFG